MTVRDEKYIPPSRAAGFAVTALHKAYFRPVFLGLDTLDLSRPALWVGNHTLYSMLDVPLMCEGLLQRGVVLRSLGDRGHFGVPVWGWLMARAGVVPGSPENCSALMENGQHVLVFPGGAREVMRRRGEQYRLIWKQRTGFARMAMKHGYDIIPFGSLGPDEALDIVLDADDIRQSKIWQWLKPWVNLDDMTRGGDTIPPLVKGLGPTLLPKPQRQYFGFGERIATAHLADSLDDPQVIWQLREQVAQAVQDQLARLQAYRAEDKQNNWSALRRWLTSTGE